MGLHMETTNVTVGTARYRRGRMEPQYFGAMGTPGEYYTDTVHTIAINTRETEFGKIVEPIPITLKAYKPYHVHQIPVNGMPLNGYGLSPHQTISSYLTVPHVPQYETPSTSQIMSPVKEQIKTPKSELMKAPPKKKWIKEYLEEEPKAPASPVSLHVLTSVSSRSNGINGVVRPTSPVVVSSCQPVPVPVPIPVSVPVAVPASVPTSSVAVTLVQPAPAVIDSAPAPLPDFANDHSKQTATSNSHGPTQIPSPPSVSSSSGSNGSAPRAGTREVHNKLEKNRRAHLKECFELLKRQLPATPDDKKCSNLSILGSAIRYIQVLRRKERECEHEMERLAREKIAAQQRLAALKREVTVRATVRPRTIDPISDDKIREEQVNGQVLGISIAGSPPRPLVSPPHTLNLSTKLRALPIQITPTTSQQVVRTSYGRHNTLTLTTLAPADGTQHQNGHAFENGVSNGLSTLLHPAQIHLPISQVVSSGGLVVGPAALQLLSTSAGLRVLQAPVHTNGIDAHRLPKENGIINSAPVSTDGGSVVVNGLTPIVVSQSGTHLLQTHTLTHKMETQMVKGSMTPLTVSAQYLSATTIVKPVVVVSNAHTHTPT